MNVPIFDTFKYSGENLPNSSCHFLNRKSVFPQILHDSSLSLKINPLYFFSSNVIFFAPRRPMKVQIFETFEYLDRNSPTSCHFWKNKSPFLQILFHSSVSWDRTLLYFFNWNFKYFQQKEPIKVQIWWNFTWAVESCKVCTSMGSFCENHVKF